MDDSKLSSTAMMIVTFVGLTAQASCINMLKNLSLRGHEVMLKYLTLSISTFLHL